MAYNSISFKLKLKQRKPNMYTPDQKLLIGIFGSDADKKAIADSMKDQQDDWDKKDKAKALDIANIANSADHMLKVSLNWIPGKLWDTPTAVSDCGKFYAVLFRGDVGYSKLSDMDKEYVKIYS